MNPFKPTAYADDPLLFAPGVQAGLTPVEAELAAQGVDDGVPDGAIAMMILMDERDDDWDSLRDELAMFRRENDLGRD